MRLFRKCLSFLVFFFFFLSLSWWHCTKPHYTVYVVRESYNLQVFRGLFLESPNNLPSSRDYSCQIISYRPWCRVFAQTCRCVTWNEKKGKIPLKKWFPGHCAPKTVSYRGCRQTADRSFFRSRPAPRDRGVCRKENITLIWKLFIRTTQA